MKRSTYLPPPGRGGALCSRGVRVGLEPSGRSSGSGSVAAPVVVRALRVACLRQLRPGGKDPLPRQSQKAHLHRDHTAVMPTRAQGKRVGVEGGDRSTLTAL